MVEMEKSKLVKNILQSNCTNNCVPELNQT